MAATDIPGYQIRDGAITNAKVAAGAAIVTTKLADGAEFEKRNGSIPWTGNHDAGTNRLTNLGTPSGGNDAATKTYVDGLISGLNSLFDSKPSCRVVATGNVTVSNPGTASFDGVTLTAGDRILLTGQSTASQNGIYVFDTSSTAMTRAEDMDVWTEVPGSLVVIEEGTTNADSIWLCTSNAGGTIGSTSMVWMQLTLVGLTSASFVDKETPSGAINGSNTAFTLANTPTAGTEHLYLNGLLQESGAGNDYTISGSNITMLTPPITGDKIRVSYRK